MSLTKSLLALGVAIICLCLVSCSDFVGGSLANETEKNLSKKNIEISNVDKIAEVSLIDISKADLTKLSPMQLKKAADEWRNKQKNDTKILSAEQLSGVFFDVPYDVIQQTYSLSGSNGLPTLPMQGTARVYIYGVADEIRTTVSINFLNNGQAQHLKTESIKGTLKNNVLEGPSGWHSFTFQMPTITSPGFYFIWSMTGDQYTSPGFSGYTYFNVVP